MTRRKDWREFLKKDDWRRFLWPEIAARDEWLIHEYEEWKQEHGREPSIAEMRAHAHEAVDEVLDNVEYDWAEERAEKVVNPFRPDLH
jgi:hypothetical protein